MVRFTRFIFLVLFLLGAYGGRAHAFPELIRHGYGSCVTCHMSTNGGGVLTAYGRSLSKEILSTWSAEGEERPFYGLVTFPEWLNVGGDFRGIQTYVNNPRFEAAKTILMQADLEAGATVGRWSFVASVGREEPSSVASAGTTLLSRHHYVGYTPDDKWYFRAGKFQAAYGINIPDHQTSIKRGLVWDEGSETYNVEAAFLGEQQQLYATAIFGRPDATSLNREMGFALRPDILLGTTNRLGLSYYFGNNSAGSRHLTGVWSTLGITPHCFILAEVDFQNLLPYGNAGAWGIVNYVKFDYEIVQGLHAFVTQEFSQTNFQSPATQGEAYGIGAQFFPRPHFEIQGVWQKRKLLAQSGDFTDMAWVMVHFYP